jgi:hypothetical protein
MVISCRLWVDGYRLSANGSQPGNLDVQQAAVPKTFEGSGLVIGFIALEAFTSII